MPRGQSCDCRQNFHIPANMQTHTHMHTHTHTHYFEMLFHEVHVEFLSMLNSLSYDTSGKLQIVRLAIVLRSSVLVMLP